MEGATELHRNGEGATEPTWAGRYERRGRKSLTRPSWTGKARATKLAVATMSKPDGSRDQVELIQEGVNEICGRHDLSGRKVAIHVLQESALIVRVLTTTREPASEST